MQWLILLALCVALLALIRHLQTSGGRLVLDFDGQRVRVVRGHLPRPGSRQLIEDVLREARVGRGQIRLLYDQRIVFPARYDAQVQQRVRNLLLD